MVTPQIGSYKCKCNKGYEGSLCSDVNECRENNHTCDKNAMCINTPGSYKCKCIEPNFFGDGKNCDYFDGCWSEPCGGHKCLPDSSIPGEYACSCENPFILVNNNCRCKLGYKGRVTVDRFKSSNMIHVTILFNYTCLTCSMGRSVSYIFLY